MSCFCVFGHSSVLGAIDKLDLVRLDWIPVASVAVKAKANLSPHFLVSNCLLLVFIFSAAFSSLILQVKMAAEEKWRGRAPKQHKEAEHGGEREPCVLRGRQLGEPGRFAYAALCGISLAWLFPENEQRYKWREGWAGQVGLGWWLSQSWCQTLCRVFWSLGSGRSFLSCTCRTFKIQHETHPLTVQTSKHVLKQGLAPFRLFPCLFSQFVTNSLSADSWCFDFCLNQYLKLRTAQSSKTTQSRSLEIPTYEALTASVALQLLQDRIHQGLCEVAGPAWCCLTCHDSLCWWLRRWGHRNFHWNFAEGSHLGRKSTSHYPGKSMCSPHPGLLCKSGLSDLSVWSWSAACAVREIK